MHDSFCIRRAAAVLPLCLAANAFAQAPAPEQPALMGPTSTPPAADTPAADTPANPAAPVRDEEPGFESGLRLGVGLPLGSAGRGVLGESRNVSDLAPWRVPVWVDLLYRVSRVASYGLYGQIGFGGAGDACPGKCDWSDLRFGAQGQWRLSPGADIAPWLGLGVGYESLSFKSIEQGQDDLVRTTELLGGPELLLQGGLELRVEDALQLGPFVAASFGSYLLDSYKCSSAAVGCPGGSSIDGSGFHAWIGIGLNGRYSP